MDLSKYKIKSESEDSYHVEHPSGKTFTFMKKGMTPKAQAIVKKMYSGGAVKMFDGGTTPDSLSANPVANSDTNTAADPVQASVQPDLQSVTAPNYPTTPNDADQPSALRQAADAVLARNGLPTTSGIQGIASDVANSGIIDPTGQGGKGQPTQSAQSSQPTQPAQTPYVAPPDQPNPMAVNAQANDAIFNQQESSAQDFLKSQGNAAAQQQQAYQDFINKQSQIATPQQRENEYKAKDDAFMQHVMDTQNVDPNRYYKNQSTGSRVLSTIGILIGGLAGSNVQNQALKMTQDGVQADIDAQKADHGNAVNLWKMNRQNMQDDKQADLATSNQLLTTMQAKAAMAAAGSNSADSRFKIQQYISNVEQQKAQNRMMLGVMSGGASGMDPSMLVPRLVPPALQPKVFDEIKNNQDIQKLRSPIMASFDKAANNIHATDFVPGTENADQKAFSSLMNTTVKEQEGTARQAAFDSINKNMKPQFGDDANTISTKRNSVINYLNSKASAPTAQGFGINLQNYQSTSGNPAMRLNPTERTYYQYAKAYPQSSISQAFFQKHPDLK